MPFRCGGAPRACRCVHGVRVYGDDLDGYLAARSETRPVHASDSGEATAPGGQPGQTGASSLPTPTSEAAGAILNAWRDTVLAPVVAELGETRQQLATLAQTLGRTEAERDSARHELAALRTQLDQHVEVPAEATSTIPAPREDQLASHSPSSLWERLRMWLRQPR